MRDPQRDDVGALGDLDPVEHHHRQADVVQPAAHQLTERGPGPLDEQLRHRALARRARLPLDLLADRLAHAGEPARRDARQHPVHHHDGQRVPVGEVLIGLDRQLALVIRRADPRAADLHPPAAQRHRPALMTVALGRPIRVVPALRADDLLDLGLHQLVHHAEPDADAQRQQPLPRGPDQLTQRLLNLRRQRPFTPSAGVTTCGPDTFFMAVPPVLSDFFVAPNAPNRSGRDGRTATQISTRSRTTSRRSDFSSTSATWSAP